jgi:phosphonopyruvate decarboxylase
MSHPSKGPSHTSKAPEFIAALRESGVDFFCGVPCSLLKGLVAELEKDSAYVSATREDSALGIAAGAFFGGKHPMVLMQNSGLGVSVNAIASLHWLYELPVLLVISWRGEDRTDAPEHWMMGEIMSPLLDLMEVQRRIVAPDQPMSAHVAWARAELDRTRRPVALIVPAGVLE